MNKRVTVAATEFQRAIGKYTTMTWLEDADIIIENYGRKESVLLSIGEYLRLKQLEERYVAHNRAHDPESPRDGRHEGDVPPAR